MENIWTKDFYQETDPVKRQQILKEHTGEEEDWAEEYRNQLWTVRYGKRRLQKDEFVRCLMELKYLAEGTTLNLGGDRGFTSLVFGMGQLSEEGIAKKIAEQISAIAFKAPRLLRMEKEFSLLQEAALRAYRQEYPNREHFLNK